MLCALSVLLFLLLLFFGPLSPRRVYTQGLVAPTNLLHPGTVVCSSGGWFCLLVLGFSLLIAIVGALGLLCCFVHFLLLLSVSSFSGVA